MTSSSKKHFKANVVLNLSGLFGSKISSFNGHVAKPNTTPTPTNGFSSQFVNLILNSPSATLTKVLSLFKETLACLLFSVLPELLC